MEFKTTTEDAGKRLDKFLVAKMPGLSRSQIQKLIKEGLAAVNGVISSSNRILKNGEAIAIEKKKGKEKNEEEEKKEEEGWGVRKEIKIIAQTPDYIIINKPASLATHGAARMQGPTLADWLLKKFPEIKKVGDDPARPGIVHRLDKEVSGLMVIARTQLFFDFLKNQFQERKVGKKYTALVCGQIKKDEEKINFPIERASAGHRMAALPLTFKGAEHAKGRQAATEFNVIKKFVNYTLLKVKIKTGRTHQIRVHMSAYGHPLVGDDLYGTKKTRLLNKKLGLGRIFLVADELAFTDLKGEIKIFKLNLPDELNLFLEKIK